MADYLANDEFVPNDIRLGEAAFAVKCSKVNTRCHHIATFRPFTDGPYLLIKATPTLQNGDPGWIRSGAGQELYSLFRIGPFSTLETELTMAKEKELKDLFLDTLKDIYFAERKILSALPKMAKAAHSPKLKAAFEKHLAETEGQVDRLDQVFASIDETPKGKTCDAIMGILDEGKEVMDEYKGMPALDAGLLAAAQAVEHYEISRYGTLRTWANELGYKDAVKLLDATLKEEKATDSALSQLAEAEVNQHAETAQAA
jgi:ferritin-like metal-binding protein YciE